jgi:hypothetical protein
MRQDFQLITSEVQPPKLREPVRILRKSRQLVLLDLQVLELGQVAQ